MPNFFPYPSGPDATLTCVRPAPFAPCTPPGPGPIGRAPAEPTDTAAQLNAFTTAMRAAEPYVIGFPGNLDFDLDAPELTALLSVKPVSLGDVDSPDSSDVGAKDFERQVLAFYAELAGARLPELYAYVTTSGWESNLHALHVARSALPEATVYLSQAAHETVRRAAEILRMPAVVVPTRSGDDTMDPDALRDLAAGRSGGAVVVATIGTTMTGAVDDVALLRRAASVAGLVHVHADAALSGLILPFVPGPTPGWGFDAGADSVAISGHKLLGFPLTASVVMERAHLVRDQYDGQYTGAQNRTMACTRSGFTAAAMWYRLRTLGWDGVQGLVEQSLAGAAYAAGQLTAAGLNVRWQAHSPIVAFTLPGPARDFARVLQRWHLPIESRPDGVLTHVVTMPHVTRSAVDALVADLAEITATASRVKAAAR